MLQYSLSEETRMAQRTRHHRTSMGRLIMVRILCNRNICWKGELYHETAVTETLQRKQSFSWQIWWSIEYGGQFFKERRNDRTFLIMNTGTWTDTPQTMQMCVNTLLRSAGLYIKHNYHYFVSLLGLTLVYHTTYTNIWHTLHKLYILRTYIYIYIVWTHWITQMPIYT